MGPFLGQVSPVGDCVSPVPVELDIHRNLRQEWVGYRYLGTHQVLNNVCTNKRNDTYVYK